MVIGHSVDLRYAPGRPRDIVQFSFSTSLRTLTGAVSRMLDFVREDSAGRTR